VLLQIDSTQADIWLNLGTVHALTGRYDKARAAWETALHYDPDHPEARNYLAQLPR
jgi:Tfp pilus assembly protein PilF